MLNGKQSKYFNTAVRMNNALIELLQKKDFEYITIKELCEKACVNRSTFYLHYENMNDLLDETGEYVLGVFCSCFDVDEDALNKAGGNFVNKNLDELNFINNDFLCRYLAFFRDNEKMFTAFMKHRDAFRVDGIYNNLFESVFWPILERFEYPEKHRKYVMKFYLNGITAVVSEWLKNDCKLEIAEICEIITESVFGRDASAFQKKN